MRSFTLLKSSDHRTIVILLLVLLLLQGVPQHLFHPGIEHDRAEFHHTEFHLDPDTADWPEFALLPGIGEKLAKAIVLYRNENSGFKRLENLQEVKGIGRKKMEAIRPLLNLGAEKNRCP